LSDSLDAGRVDCLEIIQLRENFNEWRDSLWVYPMRPQPQQIEML
jgi:hypothetical protein